MAAMDATDSTFFALGSILLIAFCVLVWVAILTRSHAVRIAIASIIMIGSIAFLATWACSLPAEPEDSVNIGVEQDAELSALKNLMTYEEQAEQDSLVAASIARNDDSVADARTREEVSRYPIAVLYPDGAREYYRYELCPDAFEEDKTDVLLYSEQSDGDAAYDRMVVVPTEEIEIRESGKHPNRNAVG